MTAIIKEALAGVAVFWTVAGYAIWRFGPGLRKRSLRCPERKQHATLIADYREAEFGGLRVADLQGCSLLTPAHPVCTKQCAARL